MRKFLSMSTKKRTLNALVSTIAAGLFMLPNSSGIVQAAPLPDVISLYVSSYTISEADGAVYMTVTRSNATAQEISVNYSTSDGSAIGGSDYEISSGTITFAAGETSKTITVPVHDDLVDENDENFNVTLSNPTNGSSLGSITSANVTIVDNDTAQGSGTFSLDRVSYSAGEGDGRFLVTINRNDGSDGEVSVDIATTNGSAVDGSDYTGENATLTFAAGETSKQIPIYINDDGDTEGDENFSIALSNPTNGSRLGSIAYAEATIIDNDNWIPDPPGQFQLASPSYTVNEGENFATLIVTRTNGAGGTVSVPYGVSSGSANEGADFSGSSGELTFAEGVTEMSISVPIIDDQEYEGNETFGVSLGLPSEGTLGSITEASVTIVDNDSPPDHPGALEFETGVSGVNEGDGSVKLTVNRVDGSDGEVSVDYKTSDGSAISGSDYEVSNGTLTFAAGETSKTITVPVINDAVHENNENFTVTLSNPTNGASLGSITSTDVTLLDNDTVPQKPGELVFKKGTYQIKENGGSVTLNVNRTNGSDGQVSVDYKTLDGNAHSGSDYETTSGTLTFVAGETMKTITVPIKDDAVFELNENFTVLLSNPTNGATLGPVSSANVSIENDDPIFGRKSRVQFDKALYAINEGEGTVTVEVVRTGSSEGELTVQYATVDGTAVKGRDYAESSGKLTFADGETSKLITLEIIDDSKKESQEKFSLKLSNPSGGAVLGLVNQAYISIKDNDRRGRFPGFPGKDDLPSIDEE